MLRLQRAPSGTWSSSQELSWRLSAALLPGKTHDDSEKRAMSCAAALGEEWDQEVAAAEAEAPMFAQHSPLGTAEV